MAEVVRCNGTECRTCVHKIVSGAQRMVRIRPTRIILGAQAPSSILRSLGGSIFRWPSGRPTEDAGVCRPHRL
jgi:hypothetical protein